MSYRDIILLLFVIACIFSVGCTWSSGTAPSTTAAPETSPSPAPTEVVTTVPIPATTDIPVQVVTIVHQISQVKDVKDSEFLFSLQVPVEWNISTRRLDNPENFIGYMYQTDLVRNNSFYIQTYINYQDRDQNYRDDCRRGSPAPNITTVTINGIVFDRFESISGGLTNVTYVARKASTNERGYLSVLAFTASTSNRFEKEDYEKVVSSFRYYKKEDVSTMPGEEIARILPLREEGGSVHSSVKSSGSSGGGSSGGSSSGGSSSGGGSSGGGGGGCHR